MKQFDKPKVITLPKDAPLSREVRRGMQGKGKLKGKVAQSVNLGIKGFRVVKPETGEVVKEIGEFTDANN